MELRKQKERELRSNNTFRTGRRKKVAKFYAIVRSSRTFYEDFLQARCPNKKVLEYGCGLGSYSFFLAKKGATVTGIDISNVEIEQAQKRARSEHLEKTNFCVMDAEALGFDNNTFDLVCGTGILHHLDLNKAFPEISRTLKPDGAAIFIEPLGYNAIINLYRKLTPDLRTEDESPLLMKDLKMAEAYFGKVETHFFHLVSLIAVLFRNIPGFTHLLKALDATDRALFRFFPLARRYAWQIVIVLSRQTTHTLDNG
jgi:ubiquinone/menaquinone biosynthesis C-methylase UbiE